MISIKLIDDGDGGEFSYSSEDNGLEFDETLTSIIYSSLFSGSNIHDKLYGNIDYDAFYNLLKEYKGESDQDVELIATGARQLNPIVQQGYCSSIAITGITLGDSSEKYYITIQIDKAVEIKIEV